MLSYLQKFHNLPKELKEKISTREVMEAVNELEKRYGISLASVVMKVMTKDISIVDLARYFVFEHHLNPRQAEQLVDELKNRVFFEVADYLGFTPDRVVGQSVEDWLKSRREEMATASGSTFFFSPDDEEEVKELAKKVHSFVKGKPFQENIEEKLDAIFDEVKINFGSEELADRFRQILRTYLRGVRNRLDTKETLKKSLESGGLGFDEKSAEEVISIADKIVKKLDERTPVTKPKKIILPEDQVKPKLDKKVSGLKNSGVRDVDYDFSKLKKGSTREEKDATLSKNISITPTKKTVVNQGQGKIADVKYVPKLVGPIEELKEMDLINFRRLSPNPVDAAMKIKEKINFLEDDGYDKKLEGIKAWRQSPLNKLYLQIGQESISRGKDIGTIIYERQKAGKEYLTQEEFVAIMDLNKELRF